jgi:hypothetical protein
MQTCQYCARNPAEAYLVAECPNEHLTTTRICVHCYDLFLAHNTHMCLNCNRAIIDWAAKLDQSGSPNSGVWITSWKDK